MNLDKGLPLAERLQRIDHIQARRFSKLTGPPMEIATEGIIRHLAACDRMDVNPDISAVREIIDDALNGRRVYAEAAEITRAIDHGCSLLENRARSPIIPLQEQTRKE